MRAKAALIGLGAPPSIAVKLGRPAPVRRDRSENNNEGGRLMIRMWSAFAVGAAVLAGVNPSAAKQNSCDGPIVLGTTISVTGINSSLAGRWDKMTEAFEKEIN